LTFTQRLEAIRANFGEVSEQIVAAIVRGDKAKAFCVIEKFNGTSFHNALHVSVKDNKIIVWHDNQGIDKETKKTNLMGNEVSIDMTLENPAPLFLKENCTAVNSGF